MGVGGSLTCHDSAATYAAEADENKDGLLSAGEINAMLLSLGLECPVERADFLLAKFDEHKQGLLTMEQGQRCAEYVKDGLESPYSDELKLAWSLVPSKKMPDKDSPDIKVKSQRPKTAPRQRSKLSPAPIQIVPPAPECGSQSLVLPPERDPRAKTPVRCRPQSPCESKNSPQGGAERKPKSLLTSSIFARIRPFASDGKSGHTEGEAVHQSGLAKAIQRWDTTSVTIKDDDRREEKVVSVTSVVPPEASQAETFDVLLVASNLLTAFHGDENVLFFAYGQTGTGKTHTMLGPSDSIGAATPVDGWGVFPRLVHATLQTIENWKAEGIAACLQVSAVEFYCGRAFDLLTKPKNEVCVDKECRIYGQTKIPLTSTEQLGEFISSAYNNRYTNATKMNDESSRGHTALVLTLHQLREHQYSCTTFSLIDMAGSERASKTGADLNTTTGTNAKKEVADMFEKGTPEKVSVGAQGFMINQEHSNIMTEIERATIAYTSGQAYRASGKPIPVSQATIYFQGCCDGRARLGAIITLSLSAQHGFETWFSLNYASKLMKLKAPVRKVQTMDIAKAKKKAEEAAAEAEKLHAKVTRDEYKKQWAAYKVLYDSQVMGAELGISSAKEQLAVLEQLSGVA